MSDRFDSLLTPTNPRIRRGLLRATQSTRRLERKGRAGRAERLDHARCFAHAEIANVRVAIDRGPAGIHADSIPLGGSELFHQVSQSIVKAQRHKYWGFLSILASQALAALRFDDGGPESYRGDSLFGSEGSGANSTVF